MICLSTGKVNSETKINVRTNPLLSHKSSSISSCRHFGPMSNPSIIGRRYFVTLYDDARTLSIVRFTDRKADVRKKMTSMIRELETAYGSNLSALSTDNGMEFLSKDFMYWLASRVIIHQLTAPYSPESNGKAEGLIALCLTWRAP